MKYCKKAQLSSQLQSQSWKPYFWDWLIYKTLTSSCLSKWKKNTSPYLCLPHVSLPTGWPQQFCLSWWHPGSPFPACLISQPSATQPPSSSDTQPAPSSLAGLAPWSAGSWSPVTARDEDIFTCLGGGSPPDAPGTSVEKSTGPQGPLGEGTSFPFKRKRRAFILFLPFSFNQYLLNIY